MLKLNTLNSNKTKVYIQFL